MHKTAGKGTKKLSCHSIRLCFKRMLIGSFFVAIRLTATHGQQYCRQDGVNQFAFVGELLYLMEIIKKSLMGR